MLLQTLNTELKAKQTLSVFSCKISLIFKTYLNYSKTISTWMKPQKNASFAIRISSAARNPDK